jgi:hypothetical protein
MQISRIPNSEGGILLRIFFSLTSPKITLIRSKQPWYWIPRLFDYEDWILLGWPESSDSLRKKSRFIAIKETVGYWFSVG